ncbi:MAG: winged helix-turn-helix domain-containing protein [Aliidongia sp.]
MKIKRFQFGDWQVDAQSCTIRYGEEAAETQIEPRAMDVLSALCHNAGRILSADDLLKLCWDGLAVGENQVHKAIAQLRRVLRDSATAPRYIENIRKRGYRTVASVSFPPHHGDGPSAEIWDRGSPYVGLDPFDAAHAAVFFGRDAAIARLRETLIAQIGGGRALVLVLGPSGSGKTSLVQAGLLPTLMRKAGPFRVQGAVTLDLGDIGTVPLSTALGGALLDLDLDGEPLFAGRSAENIGADLTGDSGTRWPSDRTQPDERFVLFVDRLEVLFSAPTGIGQRRLFLIALDRLARNGMFIVIAACRNDFYPDLAKESVLMDGKAAGGHFDLAPPARTDITQMIRLSANAAGLSFGTDPDNNDRLDDLLCDGAATSPDALPLLQYTLQQLYLQRSPARELTMTAYRALGGIDGVIGRRAETILSGLAGPSQAALPRIFSLIVADGAADGSVRSLRVPWSALTKEDERRLVRTLVAERLFVSHIHDKEAVFGVAHEALLRQWPRAVAWIAEHRQALRTRSQLDRLAQQWIAEGRQADRLLRRGKPLEEARDLADRAAVPLGAEVTALIAASIRQARRAERLRAGALAGFALIALVAVFLGFRASQAEAVAALRLDEAEDLTDYMLGDLTEKLRPLGRLDLLDGVAQKALGYLAAEDAGRTAAARLRQAKALQTLADVDRSRGKIDAALMALTQAEALLQANLAEGSANRELLKVAGAVAFWFGQIALDQGRIEEAERRFTAYRGFAQRMTVLDPEDADASIELSYALSSLGSLELKKGEGDGAAANFEQSIALKRHALQRRPEDRSLTAELANSLSWLANAEAEQGHLETAAELYDQQRDTLEALRRVEPDAAVWSYRLALANKLKGTLLAAIGRATDAQADLDQAAEQIEESLRREPDNRLWQSERVAIRLQTARISLALRRSADAVSAVAAARTEIDQAIRLNPTDEILPWQLAETHLLRATALLQQGKLDEAEKDAGQSEDLAGYFSDRDKKAKFKVIFLANILLVRAEIDQQRGAWDAAKRSCLEAADILRAVARSSNDFQLLDPWVRATSCGGDRQSAAGGIATLERMGYRDIDYLRFLSTETE